MATLRSSLPDLLALFVPNLGRDRAQVYLRKDREFPDIAARIFTEDGKIIMEFDPVMHALKNMKILRHELQDGSRRKLGDVVLEVKTTTPDDAQLEGV